MRYQGRPNHSNVSGRLQLCLQRVQPVVPVRRELHHQLLQQTERLQILPLVRATGTLSLTTLVVTTVNVKAVYAECCQGECRCAECRGTLIRIKHINFPLEKWLYRLGNTKSCWHHHLKYNGLCQCWHLQIRQTTTLPMLASYQRSPWMIDNTNQNLFSLQIRPLVCKLRHFLSMKDMKVS